MKHNVYIYVMSACLYIIQSCPKDRAEIPDPYTFWVMDTQWQLWAY